MSAGFARLLRSLDIVIPVFNEEEGLERFHAQLCHVVDEVGIRTRFIYVDDGSSDDTKALLRRLRTIDDRVELIALSRNFGHQAALTAGLEHADADVVVMMDGDGQHPPSLIPQLIQHYLNGCEIVLTQRVEDQEAAPLKRFTSGAFYALINCIGQTRLAPGAADFRLLSREALRALISLPEYHRFIRGLVAWLGYSPVIVPYCASPRIAGHPKYSVRKMLQLARDAVFSFSLLPLQLGIAFGCLFLMLAAGEFLYVIQFWLQGKQHLLVPGWSSLMFVVLIVGGCIMVLLGFVGVYVGYIFQEVKRRPVYVVNRSSSDCRLSVSGQASVIQDPSVKEVR